MCIAHDIDNFVNGTIQKRAPATCFTGETSCWLAYITKLGQKISESTHACQLTEPLVALLGIRTPSSDGSSIQGHASQ